MQHQVVCLLPVICSVVIGHVAGGRQERHSLSEHISDPKQCSCDIRCSFRVQIQVLRRILRMGVVSTPWLTLFRKTSLYITLTMFLKKCLHMFHLQALIMLFIQFCPWRVFFYTFSANHIVLEMITYSHHHCIDRTWCGESAGRRISQFCVMTKCRQCLALISVVGVYLRAKHVVLCSVGVGVFFLFTFTGVALHL